MRSKAHFKTYPLHPILIPFPIAFFTGTLVFDIVAGISGNESFQVTASYLLTGGIGTALLAAIPGFLDFLYTVPPDSTGKTRAATHAVLNLCMVGLFAAAFVYRQTNDALHGLLLIIEGSGFILMLIARLDGRYPRSPQSDRC